MTRASRSPRIRALRLMERVLRGGAPLEGEYPLVFRDGFDGRVLAIEQDGDVRSACALLVRELVAGTRRVRAGFIGSVSTDPAWRGLGLASRLLRRAREDLRREGCLLALLWADDPTFYEARGFQPVGCEIDFALEPGAARAALPRVAGIRAAAPDDFAVIHRLYGRHRERVDRSLAETRALLTGPGMEVLVVQEERDVVAYSCLGRGGDFARTVHEWGGAPERVLGLLRDHADRAERRRESGPLCLIAPPSAARLRDALRRCGARESAGVLGLAALVDPFGAAELLAQAAGDPAATVTIESEGLDGEPRIRLRGPRGERAVDSEKLLRVLFPARNERGEIGELEEATGAALDGLPVPIFAWGLDSI